MHSILFFNFSFTNTADKLWPKCIIEIVLIDNLGLKICMVNFGIKHAFKYEKDIHVI